MATHAITFRQRWRYRIDSFLTRGSGPLFLSLIVAFFGSIALIGSMRWLFHQFAPDTEHNFADQLWVIFLQLTDPGNMVQDNDTPTIFKTAAVVAGITGVVIFSAFIAFLTTALDQAISHLKKGHSQVLESGHSLILSWSPRVVEILRELVEANESESDPVVVILAEKEKEKMDEVAWLAQRTDVSAVANYFRVTWRSVRRIIQRVVAEQRDERRELDGLRVIGMDEISYRKRHKYLTVVIDHLSGRVVWAGKERKAKTLLRFFRKLGPQRAAELEAVSMDMWEPYITVVGKKAPQARVIFDRFHIVKHLNEAVDKTRRELVRELKGTAQRNLKNTKFPLLKAKHNRSAKDKRVLREQVRANRRLYRAMLLRDDFMDLYTYKTETWAKKFLRGWLRRAMSSRIEPVKRAAKMIRSHFDGVIAWVTWRLSNGRLEGMNNKIRLLSHRSFGLHSAEALISLVYLNCGGLTLERIH